MESHEREKRDGKLVQKGRGAEHTSRHSCEHETTLETTRSRGLQSLAVTGAPGLVGSNRLGFSRRAGSRNGGVLLRAVLERVTALAAIEAEVLLAATLLFGFCERSARTRLPSRIDVHGDR